MSLGDSLGLGLYPIRTNAEKVMDETFALNDLPSGMTTSRASSAYDPWANATVSTNVRRRRPANVGRFRAIGLDLIEPSATNLLRQSQDFETTWTLVNVTDTPDAVAAPDGTTTADQLQATTTAATTINQAAGAVAVTGSMVYSIYLKKGNKDTCNLVLRNVTTATNVVNATVTFSTKSISGAGASLVQDLGNGWLRFALTSSAFTSGNSVTCYAVYSGNGATAGDFTYAWGAQLEVGSSPTSYIATTAATVTRAADVLSASLASVSFGLVNSLTWSQDWTQAIWVKSNVTVTGSITAPDGTATANTLAATATAATSCSQSVVGAAAAGANTYSIWLKQGTLASCTLILRNVTTSTNVAQCTVNFAGPSLSAITGTCSIVTNLGNGWIRVQVTGTAFSAGDQVRCYSAFPGNSQTAGDSVTVWGAQLQAGSTVGDYLRVDSAAVGTLSMNQGTLMLFYLPYIHGDFAAATTLSQDPANSNNVLFQANASGTAGNITVGRGSSVGGANTASYTNAGNITGGTLRQIVMTWDANNVTLYTDGTQRAQTAKTNAYAMSTSLDFAPGSGAGSGWIWCGWLNRSLSPAEIQAVYVALPVLQ